MPNTRSEGFTLLEMLISISLIALVMLGLVIGLRVANRAWQQGEARLRQDHAEQERNDFLREQVSSLVPYTVSVEDPNLPGKFTVLEASAACLRFVSHYSSAHRSRSGLVLAEYGVAEASRGTVEVALRETSMPDDGAVFRLLIQGVTRDAETGAATIIYQPFAARNTDLVLMTGLRAARFEYLDLHPQGGPGPVWLPDWKSRPDALYPDAIRLQWERGNQAGEELVRIRARSLPQT